MAVRRWTTPFHAILCVRALFATAWAPSSRVQVRREVHLPNLATPSEAKRTWLAFVWEHGGGLPLVVAPIETRSQTDYLETSLQRRMLLPIGMQEELITNSTSSSSSSSSSSSTRPDHESVDSETAPIYYRVTNAGLLANEIVAGSHMGSVCFTLDPNNMGTRIIWNVSFDTTSANRAFIWQAVTEQTIGDSCRNLQAATANPIQYQRVTFLRYPNNNHTHVSADQAMEDWIAFCWNRGGGLPTPLPPLRFNENKDRWIIPPFLHEQLISTAIERNTQGLPVSAMLQYRVVNPGWFTYQVFSHRGTVTFQQYDDESDSIRMEWGIQIRPYPVMESFVKSFTGLVVAIYARNFKEHVARGGRGADDPYDEQEQQQTSGIFFGLAFLQAIGFTVRPDSWIGGVIQAFHDDDRPTSARLTDAVRPWVWGRGSNFDEAGESESWSSSKDNS